MLSKVLCTVPTCVPLAVIKGCTDQLGQAEARNPASDDFSEIASLGHIRHSRVSITWNTQDVERSFSESSGSLEDDSEREGEPVAMVCHIQ